MATPPVGAARTQGVLPASSGAGSLTNEAVLALVPAIRDLPSDVPSSPTGFLLADHLRADPGYLPWATRMHNVPASLLGSAQTIAEFQAVARAEGQKPLPSVRDVVRPMLPDDIEGALALVSGAAFLLNHYFDEDPLIRFLGTLTSGAAFLASLAIPVVCGIPEAIRRGKDRSATARRRLDLECADHMFTYAALLSDERGNYLAGNRASLDRLLETTRAAFHRRLEALSFVAGLNSIVIQAEEFAKRGAWGDGEGELDGAFRVVCSGLINELTTLFWLDCEDGTRQDPAPVLRASLTAEVNRRDATSEIADSFIHPLDRQRPSSELAILLNREPPLAVAFAALIVTAAWADIPDYLNVNGATGRSLRELHVQFYQTLAGAPRWAGRFPVSGKTIAYFEKLTGKTVDYGKLREKGFPLELFDLPAVTPTPRPA